MKKLKNKFSRISIAFFLLVAFSVSNKAFGQHRDFSGKWIRNEEKTEYGSLSKASFGLPTLEIVKGDGFYLVKQDSIAAHDTKLAFDGTETVSIISGVGGERKKTTIMKWIDGSSFIDSSNYSGSLNYSSTKKYILSEDGKEITIVMHVDYKTSNSEFDVKLIYDKQ